MKIYHNRIPATHLAQQQPGVPPEAILTDVTIYGEALDYIKCELTNTIRHEAAHRQDEEERQELDFSAFTEEGRAEAIAETSEQDCGPLYPQQLSEQQAVNVSQIFEECKTASGVNQTYLADVKAVILDHSKLGMYYMQELPGMYNFQEGEMRYNDNSDFERITGWDGKQYINVARHFEDWLVKGDTTTYSPNVQVDGVTVDPDRVRQDVVPSVGSAPTVPVIPAAPSVESR